MVTVAHGAGATVTRGLCAIRLHLLADPAPGAVALPSVIVEHGFVTHSVGGRSNSLSADQINAADCHKNDLLSFPLTVSGSQGLSLQAWAGTLCDEAAVRTSTVQQQCWPLDTRAASDGTLQLTLPVRDILYGRTAAADPALGALAKPAQLDPRLACEVIDGILQAQTLSVYFMLVDGTDHVTGTYATYDLRFKLTPPRPPDQVSVASAGEALVVKFAYLELSADNTLDGFEAYCDPAPGGSHEGPPLTADPGSCQPSTLLVAGADSGDLLAHRCGSAAKSASTITARSLTAGVAYNVALTAFDSYENESVLSPLVCQIPEPKDESMNEQKSAACAFSRRPRALPLFAVLGIAALLIARRRRYRIAATVATS